MTAALRPRRTAASDTIQHEMSLIDSAILLLAGGGATRVTLTGLRFAERVLPAAQRTALAMDIVVRPLWRPDGAGCDIGLERLV